MAPPKVFISYSQESPAHDARVLGLANRLNRNGVDAVVDQYESFPARGWSHWAERQIRDARFTLVVCTETYRRRWDGDEEAGVGLGASDEARLIRQLLYDAQGVNERFLPVVFTESDRKHIPLQLRDYTHYLVDDDGYLKLWRLVTNRPEVVKPPLGTALPVRAAKPDFRNRFWTVPRRNPFFTGRNAQLDAIRRGFAQSEQPQAISGLGGIGKTQTAIEYAHRYRAEYSAVLWVVADSRDAMLSGFAALAGLLNLPQKDEKDLNVVAGAVRRWLEANSGWLLVLDNVEDLALVRDFVPEGAAGHVLVTTLLPAAGEFAELVELKKMQPEEGALFLLRRSKIAVKNDHQALARDISIELDGLPLALDQAGAFIEETPSTLAEYLILYRAEGAALRARRGRALDHPSVTITFSLAFGKVAEANPAAAELVRGCAFLAPDAIPEEIFTQAGSDWGELIAEVAAKPLAWVEAIEAAGRFALIRRDAENKSIRIHRLVQEVIKDEMDSETRRRWADRVVGALNAVFPGPEFKNWPQCERLLPHAKVAARHVENFGLGSVAAARLLNNGGYYLDDRAQYAEAEPFFCRALSIREEAFGPEHRDTAISLNNLAVLYYNQGRYPDAEPLFRRALAIEKKTLGPEHPNTAESLNDLAALYYVQGRYAEAEPLYCRSLAIRERALGPEHPGTANSLSNLASLYDKQGRYPEADPLYYRALAIREKALGPGHPHTAISLAHLARLYHHQGRYPEAEPLYRRALAILENVLGIEHPHTATNLNNLALLYYNQGRYSEAEPLYRRALAIREKMLGPKHASTSQSLNNLAVLYDSQGRYPEAEPLYRRALAIREEAVGPEHPDTAISIRNLAGLLRKLGREAEAEELEARVKAAGA